MKVPDRALKNIFILGCDAFNRRELASIREAEQCRFHGLLGYDEIVDPGSGVIEFEVLRRRAEEQLAAVEGNIDGIVAFWDFPSSAMAGVLRNAHRLPGPSNEAIAKCEHKYWSRLEQREVVPDLIPAFCAIDPFSRDPAAQLSIAYPFWIKPIKAHSSRLGFKIRNPADLAAHLPEIRRDIGFFAAPFDEYLAHVDVPETVRPVTGHWCIAESLISAGQQCTLEGYVYEGEVVVYGVVDSIRAGKHRSCFSRYQYPSQLPQRVQTRMIDATRKVMTRMGYECAPFNIEFFWDRQHDRIRLLEINTRISKSHCPLFRMVDGASHQEVMVDLAMGVRPEFPRRQGEFATAAKFMHRYFQDGLVRRMPGDQQLRRLQSLYPESRVLPLVEEGSRLRDSAHRDSYSFELADIFLGGRDRKELLQKFDHALEVLTFDIAPVEEDAV
jgi:biotin carboxylase